MRACIDYQALTQLALKSGLTTAELAKRLGVSQPTVSRMATGKVRGIAARVAERLIVETGGQIVPGMNWAHVEPRSCLDIAAQAADIQLDAGGETPRAEGRASRIDRDSASAPPRLGDLPGTPVPVNADDGAPLPLRYMDCRNQQGSMREGAWCARAGRAVHETSAGTWHCDICPLSPEVRHEEGRNAA